MSKLISNVLDGVLKSIELNWITLTYIKLIGYWSLEKGCVRTCGFSKNCFQQSLLVYHPVIIKVWGQINWEIRYEANQ